MLAFFKRTGGYAFGNIFNAAIPFVLLPVLVSQLTPAEFGQVSMYQMLVYGLFGLSGFCGYLVANRKFFDEVSDSQKNKLNTAVIYLSAMSTLLVLILCWFLEDDVEEILGIDASFCVAAAISAFCLNVIYLRVGQWQVRGHALPFLFLNILKFCFEVVLTIVLIYSIQGAESRVIAMLIVNLFLFLVCFFLLKKNGLLSNKTNLKSYRELIVLGGALVPNFIGVFILTAADRLIISRYLDLDSVGVYMVAMQFSSVLLLFYDALNKTEMPKINHRLKEASSDKLFSDLRFLKTAILMVIFIGGASYVLMPFFMSIFLTEEYVYAIELVGLLVLGQIIGGLTLLLSNYILYYKENFKLSLITFFSGVIHILLGIELLVLYGLFGLTLAFLISKLSQLLMVLFCVFKAKRLLY